MFRVFMRRKNEHFRVTGVTVELELKKLIINYLIYSDTQKLQTHCKPC